MTVRRGLADQIVVAKQGNHISPEYTAKLCDVMLKAGEHHGAEHARWRDVRKDIRDKYKAFAIVRNPWSRTVSRFTFYVLAAEHGKIKIPVNYTFKQFLEERHKYGGREFYWHRAIRGWYPQVDYVTDEAGALKCDILRLEHFYDDSRDLLGITDLPVRNISNIDRKDYRTFYGPDEQELVADWYKRDVEFFGFTFDGPATRNIWNVTS